MGVFNNNNNNNSNMTVLPNAITILAFALFLALALADPQTAADGINENVNAIVPEVEFIEIDKSPTSAAKVVGDETAVAGDHHAERADKIHADQDTRWPIPYGAKREAAAAAGKKASAKEKRKAAAAVKKAAAKAKRKAAAA